MALDDGLGFLDVFYWSTICLRANSDKEREIMAQAATARPSEDEEMMAEEDPPVPVKNDYTQKPQKPITLKPGIAEERVNAVSWSRPPGEILGADPEQGPGIPAAAETPVRTTVQWTLDGISEEVRDEAIESAKLEGVPVGEWLDGVLRDVLFEPIPDEPLDEEYDEPDGEYAEEYEEDAEPSYEYQAGGAEVEEMAPAAEPQAVAVDTRADATTAAATESSAANADLRVMLREISERLSALERRRSLWDAVRSLFGGR